MATNLATISGRIVIDTSGIAASLQAAQDSVTAFGNNLKTIGSSMSTYLTVPIAGIGAAAVTTAADFESSMNILEVVSRSSGTAISDLSKATLQAGNDSELFGVSAASAAESLTSMYKSGMTTADIFGGANGLNSYLNEGASLNGVFRASVDLAAASEMDLGKATDAIIVAMKTFGKSGEDATSIADNFVRTANSGVLSVTDLRDSLETIGPTASNFGFSFEEVNQALAILSTRGIKGSEAGTALKSMLTNMMRQTDDVKGSLSALNVELYNTDGTMRSLPDIIGQFSQALNEENTVTRMVGGATAEMSNAASKAAEKMPALTNKMSEQQAALAILQRELGDTNIKFGEGSIQAEKKRLAITKLTNDIAENQTKMTGYQGAIDGVNNSQAHAVTSTVKLTEEQRNIAIQTIAGTYGMKAMNTLVTEGTAGWNKMGADINAAAGATEMGAARTQGFSASMSLLKDTISTFLTTVGLPLLDTYLTPLVLKINEVVGAISTGFNPAWGGTIAAVGLVLAGIGPLLLAFGTVITVVASVGAALAGIVGAALTPFGLAVGVLGLAVVAGATAIATNFGGIQEKIGAAWVVIEPILSAFVLTVGARMEQAMTIMKDITKTVLDAVGEWWKKHQDSITPIITAIQAFFTDTLKAGLTLFQETSRNVLFNIQTWWTTHKDEVVAKITAVLDGVAGLLSYLKKGWEDNGPLIKQAASTAWEGIKSTITTVVTTIQAAVKLYLDTAKEMWDKHGPQIKQIAESLWNGVKTVIGGVIDVLKVVIPNFLDGIKQFWNQNGEAIKQVVSAAWGFYKSTIEMQINMILAVIQTVLNAIQSFWQNHGQTLMASAQAVWQSISQVIQGATQIISGVIQMMAGVLTGNWQQAGQGLVQIWQGVWQTMTGFLQGAAAQIIGAVTLLGVGALNAITGQNWDNMGRSVVEGMTNGIRNGISMVEEAARNMAQSAMDAAMDALDMHSPSRKFGELGGFVSEGMAIGVKDKSGLAADAVSGMAVDMTKAMNPQTVGGGGTNQNTTNANRIQVIVYAGNGDLGAVGSAAEGGVMKAARAMGIA